MQREAWRIADAAVFDHVWLFDHLLPIHQEPTQEIHDGWTLLGAMAASTSRARIGLNVTGNLYRHPGLLAKIAVTVDHLSGGRLEMGIGAGWNEPEFRMYGMAFPDKAAERIDRLEEAIKVLKLLWTTPRATFEGRYYQLAEAIAERSLCIAASPRSGSAETARSERCASAASTRGVELRCVADDRRAMGRHTRWRRSSPHCAAVGRDPATIRRRTRSSSMTRRRGEDRASVRRAGFTISARPVRASAVRPPRRVEARRTRAATARSHAVVRLVTRDDITHAGNAALPRCAVKARGDTLAER